MCDVSDKTSSDISSIYGNRYELTFCQFSPTTYDLNSGCPTLNAYFSHFSVKQKETDPQELFFEHLIIVLVD